MLNHNQNPCKKILHYRLLQTSSEQTAMIALHLHWFAGADTDQWVGRHIFTYNKAEITRSTAQTGILADRRGLSLLKSKLELSNPCSRHSGGVSSRADPGLLGLKNAVENSVFRDGIPSCIFSYCSANARTCGEKPLTASETTLVCLVAT